jgi:heat shock protein HslJ
MPVTAVSLLIVALAAGTPDRQPPASANFRCGDTLVRATFPQGEAHLEVDGRTFRLEQAPSASGARYVAAQPVAIEFWSRGSEATLTLDGRQYPTCTRVSDQTVDVPPGTWNVLQMAGEPIEPGSRVTLVFDHSTRVTGNTTCNTYSTSYTSAPDGGLTFAHLLSTLKACVHPALQRQERLFLDLLGQVTRFEIDSRGHLILSGEDGRTIEARRADP